MEGRNMRRLLLLLAGALLVAFILPGAVAAKKPATGTYSVPVTGTYDATDTALGGTFAGEFAISRFARQGGGIVAIGNLTGTATDTAGAVVRTVDRALMLPVGFGSGAAAAAAPAAVTATCDVLHLTLGPLDLDLLGLVIHLDQIQLDITAEQAPGNLLGNLLCAVTHLLDGSSPLGGLTNLLNQILSILQGLCL